MQISGYGRGVIAFGSGCNQHDLAVTIGVVTNWGSVEDDDEFTWRVRACCSMCLQ